MRTCGMLLALAAVVLIGCARTARNPAVVVPYEGGLFVASAFAQSEEGAMRSAVLGADMTCNDRGRQLAVTRTTATFRGVVSREVTDAISTIEKILADTGAAPIPDLSTDQDYKVNVEFRCEPRGRG